MSWPRRLWPAVKRRPWRTALVVFALVLTAGAVAWGGPHVRAWRHYKAAEEASARRDFAAALVHLAACLQTWPDSIPTHLLAARTARRAGQLGLAQRHLEACRRLEPDPSEATRLEWDLLRAQAGDRRPGARLKGLVESGHPDRFLILEACVQGYLKTQRVGEALFCLDWWLERQPGEVQALLWRGRVWEHLNRPAEAERDFRRAVEEAPDLAEPAVRLARVLMAQNRPGEAAPPLERAHARQPGEPAVLAALGRCRVAQGRPEEARPLLEHALAAQPHDAEVLLALARLELDAGRPDAAEPLLRRGATAAPDDREVLFTLARCLQQLGKDAEAGRWQAKIAPLDQDLKRLDEIQRRLTKDPSGADLRHEAAQIVFRYQKDADGLSWLLSALEDDPHHRPTHLALAEYYQRAGRPEFAEVHRRQAGAAVPTARRAPR